jgi:hypothetical protein
MWGSGCIDQCFLDLSTSWKRVVASRPDHFTLKVPTLPIGREADWAPESVLTRQELQPLGLPACSQSLKQLRYCRLCHVPSLAYKENIILARKILSQPPVHYFCNIYKKINMKQGHLFRHFYQDE